MILIKGLIFMGTSTRPKRKMPQLNRNGRAVGIVFTGYEVARLSPRRLFATAARRKELVSRPSALTSSCPRLGRKFLPPGQTDQEQPQALSNGYSLVVNRRNDEIAQRATKMQPNCIYTPPRLYSEEEISKRFFKIVREQSSPYRGDHCLA
jgi:hypothetical protein